MTTITKSMPKKKHPATDSVEAAVADVAARLRSPVQMSEKSAGLIIREPSTMAHSLTLPMTGANRYSSSVAPVR